MEKKPRILAVVVTFNAMHWLDRCIGSLLESGAAPDVLVIDNCSLDGTEEYLRERYPNVTLIENQENIGFGAANNIGFRHALDGGYDFVYLMNQDAWVEKDTLSLLVAAAAPAYAVLSPVQHSDGRKLDAMFSKRCGPYLKRGARVCEVPFVMAAHWLVRRDAIETVGGFSPAFSHCGEDDNWLDRARYFGYKAAVVTDASAVHDRAGRDKAPRGADRDTKKKYKAAAQDRRMYLKCLSTVIKVVDPGRSFAARIFVEPLELVGMAVKNFSIAPLKYIPKLVRRYGELRRCRAQSGQKGAFL